MGSYALKNAKFFWKKKEELKKGTGTREYVVHLTQDGRAEFRECGERSDEKVVRNRKVDTSVGGGRVLWPRSGMTEGKSCPERDRKRSEIDGIWGLGGRAAF